MKNNRFNTLKRSIILALIIAILFPTPSRAASISIDGNFNDWNGQPHISDPRGDVTPARVDLINFFWATNPGTSSVFFMIERDIPGGRGNADVVYRVFIDSSCNGSYNESIDRKIFVEYKPSNNSGATGIQVLTGTGLLVSSASGNWGDQAGDPTTGGTRTEFSVTFEDLGINTNQQICMYVASYQNSNENSPSDWTDPITWAPIPTIGYPLMGLLVAGFIMIAWHRRYKQSRISS